MNKVKSMLLAIGLTSGALVGGVFVAHQEGVVLGSYVDPVGIDSACFGRTGPDIKPGQTFTEQQCLAMLAEDLDMFNQQLMQLVEMPISDSEHAAYLSFIYNVGGKNFASSTLRKKLNAGDRVGACNELPRWVYAKGEKLAGLINRREAERKLCLQELIHVSAN